MPRTSDLFMCRLTMLSEKIWNLPHSCHTSIAHAVGLTKSILQHNLFQIYQTAFYCIISPIITLVSSLRSMLTKVKDTLALEKKSKVVYQVPCSCGEIYIGETLRRLETRMKEHQDACQKGTLEKSALAEHAWENHHPIKWEETTVIDQARTSKELMLKEAIHIRLNHPSLNRDGGLELPGCWMAALRKAIPQLPVTPLDVASGDSA